MICNLYIKDIKAISKLLEDLWNIDLSHFTYVILKIKLEQFCDKYKIQNVKLLENRIETSPLIKEDLLIYLYSDGFELFRDPSFWRTLKEDILKNINTNLPFRVLFPACHQGAELLSFLMLRDVLGLTDKVSVMYSYHHQKLNQVKNGFNFDERKHQLNLSNYKRINGEELPEKYLRFESNKLIPSSDLFINTVAFHDLEIASDLNKSVNGVIYRNKLLNYKRNIQNEIISGLATKIKSGGFLALGIKEQILKDSNKELLTMINKKESIYKKKNVV